MDVITQSQSAMTKVTESIRLKYNMSTRGDEPLKEITASILKDDATVGFFNMSRNGITGFSLHEGHGLSQEEIKQVFQNAIDDATGVLS